VAEKRQFMALVEPDTLARLDALRIVMGISRARVSEKAMLGAGLEQLEAQYDERMQRLVDLAAKRRMTLAELTERYATLYARKTYGPTLEELEKDRSLLYQPVEA
jgi:hypothetical protein